MSAETAPTGDYWTMGEVTGWLNSTFDQVLAAEDRIVGTRALWCEWSAFEHHFPDKFRKGTIQLLDSKMQAAGLPSLRTLICIQDGGSEQRM